MSNLLSISIVAVHALLVVFMIIAPFTGRLELLVLHVIFSISLVIHWSANSNICCLSTLEAWSRGIPVSKTFINQFIEPVYVIGEHQLSLLIWASTLGLVAVSTIRILTHEKSELFLACIRSQQWQQCIHILR